MGLRPPGAEAVVPAPSGRLDELEGLLLFGSGARFLLAADELELPFHSLRKSRSRRERIAPGLAVDDEELLPPGLLELELAPPDVPALLRLPELPITVSRKEGGGPEGAAELLAVALLPVPPAGPEGVPLPTGRVSAGGAGLGGESASAVRSMACDMFVKDFGGQRAYTTVWAKQCHLLEPGGPRRRWRKEAQLRCYVGMLCDARYGEAFRTAARSPQGGRQDAAWGQESRCEV